PWADGRHPLAVSLDAAVARRPLVPSAPAAVGGVLQPESRRERRAEDDGDHRWGVVHRRIYRNVPYPVLGGADRAHGDWPRYAGRRLADHSHDGIEDHQAAAGPRHRRGKRLGAWR